MNDPAVMFADSARGECRRVGEAVVDEIRQNPNTPYDPLGHEPHLRDSYYVADTERGADIKSRVGYWAYVEYGHRLVAWGHQTGRWVAEQPHVRPAVEAVRAANVA